MFSLLKDFIEGAFFGICLLTILSMIVLIVWGIGSVAWHYTDSQPLTGAACVCAGVCIVAGIINVLASR